MADSISASAPRTKNNFSFRNTLVLSLLVPVLAVVAVYQLDRFDPAPLPLHELARSPLTAPLQNDHVLRGAEFVGAGRLLAPEDIAYHRESGMIYTGCVDGWVKRVTVSESAADSVVEDWVKTGGRPLGLAFGRHNEVIVADAYKGLLNISEDGRTVKLLTDEAEGQKFKLTDAVDVADDGMIYFTDGSYKYSLEDHLFDILEGRPYGRLLSYDPSTEHTKVLVQDLYFANGVVVSPDQNYLIFCETAMRRCRKYHIRGEKKGKVEEFLNNLSAFPDNIRYDGQGRYWVALAAGVTTPWDLAMRYPFLRKITTIMEKFGLHIHMENAGVLEVDLEGKPIARYYDPGLSLISSGIKIGNHLFFGSIQYPHIIRLNLKEYPAHSAA